MATLASALIVNVIELILSVVSIAGIIYLTRFAFKGNLTNTTVCVSDMTKEKLTMAKVAVVLLWIQIMFGVLSSIFGLMSRGKTTTATPVGAVLSSAFR
jgi:hypothetical protein